MGVSAAGHATALGLVCVFQPNTPDSLRISGKVGSAGARPSGVLACHGFTNSACEDWIKTCRWGKFYPDTCRGRSDAQPSCDQRGLSYALSWRRRLSVLGAGDLPSCSNGETTMWPRQEGDQCAVPSSWSSWKWRASPYPACMCEEIGATAIIDPGRS